MADKWEEDLILEATAPSGAGNGVGDTGHMLGSAGEDDVGHSRLDHGHPGNGGLHAGNTDPVNGSCRYRVRDAGHKGGNPGDI